MRRTTVGVAIFVATLSFVPAGVGTSNANTVDLDAVSPVILTTPCGNGISALRYLPAAGFNPLTATDDELDANGLPPRPPNTDEASLTTWTKYVTSPIRQSSSCQELSPSYDDESVPPSAVRTRARLAVPNTVPPGNPVRYPNWAGWIATGHSYTGVYATWNIPTEVSQAPNGAYSYSVDWVGLNTGDSPSQPLLQDGSEESGDNHNPRVYRLWWEAYPLTPKENINVAGLEPDDTLFAYTHATSSTAYFRLNDETAGFDETYTYSHSLPTNPHAEWIMERPTENGGLPYLAVAPMTFVRAKAQGSGLSITPVGQVPHYPVNMYTCDLSSTELAYPSVISSDDNNFSTHWLAPGGGQGDTGC